MRIKELLRVEESPLTNDDGNKTSAVSWLQHTKLDGIRLQHFKAVSTIEWHRKGDYFTTVVPSDILEIIFDFAKLFKKLETKLREISSIAIHPGGDNVIVGSKEGKMCWFDMDLSSQPYKTLKTHPKDITNVAFHRSYPLFASCSDDCTAYILTRILSLFLWRFSVAIHGMVYSDLNQDPLIVPLEILRGHTSSNGRGVLDCKFHPRQPWLFTAGADSVIKLYCH
ncbi:uncharacterized protein A4U43_C10F19550 [Asparagus officinalis]|uniref:BOP1 N-terminal domain-containing protein n=1 Tax=Asparagus officinalis TaxID=4686 RepID=A0A5P1E8W6_ASPOF|nr:uncharacterized protein A4U43_C10F19550 [Asparagus officinalis]